MSRCICEASALRVYSTMACEAVARLRELGDPAADRILCNADAHSKRIAAERAKCPEHVHEVRP